jgi:hypothetical protein
MKMRFYARGAALLAIGSLVVAGCSKSGGGPTSPSPPDTPPAPLAAPANVRLAALDIRNRTATLSWNAVADAASYIVDVATTPGGSDLGVIATGNTNASLTVPDLPAGRTVYVRVRAQEGDRTSTPSAEMRFYLQDYKYLVEALMLQTGPYFPVAAPFDGVRGWVAGTRVRVRMSNTLTGEQRRGVEGIVAQLARSGAPYQATLDVMNSNTASFGRNEIRVVTLSNTCGTGIGCTSFANTSLRQTTARIFGSAVVYLGTPGQRGDAADVAAHEMGHALFGLWHVGYQNVPEAPQFPSQLGTLEFPFLAMYYGFERNFRSPLDSLSDLELQVVQEVFRAGISAGAVRADLQARGLIH